MKYTHENTMELFIRFCGTIASLIIPFAVTAIFFSNGHFLFALVSLLISVAIWKFATSQRFNLMKDYAVSIGKLDAVTIMASFATPASVKKHVTECEIKLFKEIPDDFPDEFEYNADAEAIMSAITNIAWSLLPLIGAIFCLFRGNLIIAVIAFAIFGIMAKVNFSPRFAAYRKFWGLPAKGSSVWTALLCEPHQLGKYATQYRGARYNKR